MCILAERLPELPLLANNCRQLACSNMQFMTAKCMIDDAPSAHCSTYTARHPCIHVLNKQLVTAKPTEYGAQKLHEKPSLKTQNTSLMNTRWV